MDHGDIPIGDAVERLIERALEEDIGRGDVTSEAVVPSESSASGVLVAGGWGVMAGMPLVQVVFRKRDSEVQFDVFKHEGSEFQEQEILARVRGPARALLSAERVALNFLQRLCGIAGLTRLFVKRLHGTDTVVLDTRKTTPGLRALEKYAVRMGGGQNHRFGLDDMVLIKDNHLRLAGGIAPAIAAARDRWPTLKVEVEVGSLEELDEALKERPDRVMLDNMPVSQMKEAVAIVRGTAPGTEIEASGGVALASVRKIADTGVDFVSIGALTHSAPACDISFELEPQR